MLRTPIIYLLRPLRNTELAIVGVCVCSRVAQNHVSWAVLGVLVCGRFCRSRFPAPRPCEARGKECSNGHDPVMNVIQCHRWPLRRPLRAASSKPHAKSGAVLQYEKRLQRCHEQFYISWLVPVVGLLAAHCSTRQVVERLPQPLDSCL